MLAKLANAEMMEDEEIMKLRLSLASPPVRWKPIG
jgi:hypothetical protein